MWRRTYLLLLLVRVYFALQASYLHPDEHFQGPEVFAGRIFSYPARLPWEFTSGRPVRSVFPLWPVYGLPMNLLKWLYSEAGWGMPPPPEVVYYLLRGGMFLLSFVLEDWAVYELVPSPRLRRETVVLVASSYVTWTYQTHTFSNSIETLLVLWGLVLLRRIVENKQHSSFFSSVVLAFIVVAGVFNRITFPAFFFLPGLQLLPHFLRNPIALFSFVGCGLAFAILAVLVDTSFYRPSASPLDILRSSPSALIVTPINNLAYNSDPANLATHGIHPRYQHFAVNLPQLLGPAYVALVLSLFSSDLSSSSSSSSSWLTNARAVSALSAAATLSIFPHQEPRFLIPCVPLLLSCLPPLRRSRVFLVSWVLFNAALGLLMGVYHQGGVVPAQLALRSIVVSAQAPAIASQDVPRVASATVLWWKTYSPPLWLLGDNSSNSRYYDVAAANPVVSEIETRDLMGIPGPELIQLLQDLVPACPVGAGASAGATATDNHSIYLVAPKSAVFLDKYVVVADEPESQDADAALRLHPLWSYAKHISLDDLDFGDGVVPGMIRIVARRGIAVWAVRRAC